ncbi:unnamed protein product [Prunus armeniaca]
MMRLDEKSSNFYCTEIGRIASHFYVQCTLDSSYCRCISESPPIELQNGICYKKLLTHSGKINKQWYSFILERTQQQQLRN